MSALRVRGVALAVVTTAAAVAVFNFGTVNSTRGGGYLPAGARSEAFGINLGPAGLGPRPRREPAEPRLRLGWRLPPPSSSRFWSSRSVVASWPADAGSPVQRARRGRAAIDVRNVKPIAFGISALIAGVAGTLYAYNFGSVSADRFHVLLALSLIAFAYAGGITPVSGAVFAGLIAAQGDRRTRSTSGSASPGTGSQLFGGLVLIFTLIQNPEGVAGSFYRTLQARAKRKVELATSESAEAA